MAIATPPPATERLTYEQYLAEGEIKQRYNIIDGVRILMPAPKWRHQRVGDNVTELLRRFERSSSVGLALSAPFDVLISRNPLHTRQPDVLFITQARLDASGGIPEDGPLEVAPEIVVEIISDSETQRIFEDKLADYISIGVYECWKIMPPTRTVEVLRLTQGGAVSVAVYNETQTLYSIAVPSLTLPVAEIFAL
jgi:Uma2 family endonuclease